jgi:hypothetical protein
VGRAASSAPVEEPEGQAKPVPSGRLLLRMPRALHAELTVAAEREGVSLNQFITSTLANAVGLGGGEGGAAGVAVERPVTAQTSRHARLVVIALFANVVVIGLAAIAAIAVLLLAWRG